MASIEPRASIRTALIVEDDPIFQKVVAEALTQLGGNWLVRSYRTGREALDSLGDEDDQPRIGLVDLGLPDMPGENLILELRARLPSMPILVISVFSDERKVFNAIRAGAIGYLLKGDEMLEMTVAMRSVLEGVYPISPILARYFFEFVAEGKATPLQDAPKLSQKELALLNLIAEGNSYAEAAKQMGLRLSTVQSYSRNLYRKLNCHSQIQAIAKAREYHLLG